MMVEAYQLVISFVWAFLLSVFAIPSIIFVAHRKNLLDVPNLRTIHEELTPRLGGLAIFAGFVSALFIFGDLGYGIQEVLAGALIIFFIGLKDDLTGVSPFKKFFVQVLASGIIMFMGDLVITDFQGVMGLREISGGFEYAFTFFLIIGLTNAINLIDGVDGLAGSIVSLICILFGFTLFNSGTSMSYGYAMIAFCLFGSLLGFLRYNMIKARIFMGDTGSLICGLVISVLAIKFIELKPVDNSPAFAVAVLFIPILDTLRVFIFRILKGVSPFAPDKNHIHHRLMDIGMSQLGTVLFLVVFNLFLVSVVLFCPVQDVTTLLFILFTLGFLFSVVLELVYFYRKKMTEAKSLS